MRDENMWKTVHRQARQSSRGAFVCVAHTPVSSSPHFFKAQEAAVAGQVYTDACSRTTWLPIFVAPGRKSSRICHGEPF